MYIKEVKAGVLGRVREPTVARGAMLYAGLGNQAFLASLPYADLFRLPLSPGRYVVSLCSFEVPYHSRYSQFRSGYALVTFRGSKFVVDNESAQDSAR